jgi:aerobic-type carbon monoxide dehydrogenase small subunit (CoxS/CutS family)
MRVEEGIVRADPIRISVDDAPVTCFPGESVATAMLAHGLVRFREDSGGKARGLFCNMGSCGECIVRIGSRRLRACLTEVSDGMQVTTGG